MRTLLTLCVAAVAAMAMLGVSLADTMSSSSAATATIVTPDSLTWSPVKGIDGATMAVLAGDPTKAGGIYTVRMKLTDGTKVPLHWHNDSERVTVLSGTLMFATGNSFNMASMKALGPGSFIYIPATVRHYAQAKGDTLLQITGNGAMTFNLVK